MRLMTRFVAAVLAPVFVLSACATDPATSTIPTVTPGAVPDVAPSDRALSDDVFPFADATARFSTGEGVILFVTMETTAQGARMTVADDEAKRGHYDWRRDGNEILLSDGPDRWVAMLRVGALPGASWESSGRTIRFDGWERVKTPAGVYDAVRITSSATSSSLVESETWWFSPGVGLVRLTQNKGNLFRTEMWRTR